MGGPHPKSQKTRDRKPRAREKRRRIHTHFLATGLARSKKEEGSNAAFEKIKTCRKGGRPDWRAPLRKNRVRLIIVKQPGQWGSSTLKVGEEESRSWIQSSGRKRRTGTTFPCQSNLRTKIRIAGGQKNGPWAPRGAIPGITFWGGSEPDS